MPPVTSNYLLLLIAVSTVTLLVFCLCMQGNHATWIHIFPLPWFPSHWNILIRDKSSLLLMQALISYLYSTFLPVIFLEEADLSPSEQHLTVSAWIPIQRADVLREVSWALTCVVLAVRIVWGCYFTSGVIIKVITVNLNKLNRTW